MRFAIAWVSVALIALVLGLGGCSREKAKETDSLGTTSEALSTVMTRTYGFESLTDWSPYSSTPTLALSNTHTEGLKSLAVSGGGWSSFISRALSKEEPGPDVVGFDLRIPTSQPNPDWYGTIELFVDIPSRGVNNQPLGIHMLTEWTPGQWKRAEFGVPAWIKTAMNGSYSDLRFRIQLNVPTNATGQYLFDKLELGYPPPACTPQSDNNPCTADTCDANGQQQHTPLPAGTTCADGNACNGAETCNATGTCVAGTPVVCAASDQCHDVGTCNPSTGVCSNPAKPNGAACSDSNACTQTDTCQAGSCTGGNPVVCTASDQCHDTGTCNTATGVCSDPPKANGSACNDGDACTQTDSCQGGACTGGNPVVCVASDACHVAGTCNTATGVCSNPAKPDGSTCADATVCNGAETCTAGTCVAGAPPVVDDGNPCTADSCDPVGGVAHTPVAAGTSCADADLCDGAETCNGSGQCVSGTAVTCVTSDQCHLAGTCNPSTGVCSNPAKADGSSCSDGNACTQTDTCQAGSCSGGNAVVCVASDACHDVGTCNTATGVCSTPTKPDGTACADATVCNGAETCSAGTCVAGAPPVVDDANPCTADACDPVTGVTHTPVAAGTSCSNGDACDGAETCDGAGQCASGTPVVCVASDQCHLAGACDPATGACSNPAKPDGASCNDTNACTTSDSCQSGACVGANPVVCVASDACHAAGTCNPTTGACSDPVLPNGTSCDDATVCNGLETCTDGTCTAGTPIDVDDDNPCTADGCDPVNGAFHDPVAAGTSCETDGNVCNGASACDGAGTCQAGTPPVLDDQNPCTADACDPVAGVTHTPVAVGTSCSDANACNGDELCNAFGACLSGPPPSLDDSNPCTVDACDPVLGVTHTPAAAGTSCANATVCDGAEACDGAGTCQPSTPLPIDDGNPCTTDACDAVLGVTHVPAADGTSCADANVCNGAETCQAGTCAPGTPLDTDDGNLCTADSCDPVAGVTHAPVIDGTSCADADLCDGAETCQAGTCAAGAPVDVDDGNVCTTDACDPTTGAAIHTAVADGTSCANTNVCDGAETCQAGTCAAGTPVATDDGNPCTDDTCDAVMGVAHTLRPAGTSCSDFDLCNGSETCDASGTCQVGTPVPIDMSNACSIGTCNPATGVVTYSPAPQGTSCSVDVCTDGACNGAGECTPSGTTVQDDGDPCTIEWCDPVLGPQTKTCSAIDTTVGTTLYRSMKWIYEQPNPVQIGVAPGTIQVERAAALSGYVRTRDGSVLPGVNITLHDHPEFGQTLTRVDGIFDMVVNGGGTFKVRYEKKGYLPVQRAVTTIWGERVELPDVVMIPTDPVSTLIDLVNQPEEFQVARASVQTDADGTRQSTLLVPSGTQATMDLSDGSTVDLGSMNVRITEYTVGDTGPMAMPAELPPETDYTHAFELSADEAIAADATTVRFSAPLVYYVDNYRQLPVGWLVPFGSFNRESGLWQAEESGVVLGIVAESGGAAQVDVTGDGIADTGAALAAYGISDAELQQLGTLYDLGDSLWRVRVTHATPFDANSPIVCEDCPPPNDPPLPDPDPDHCEVAGASSIRCEGQVLKESIPIAGTPLTLNYSSDRVPGRRAAYTVQVPLLGPTTGGVIGVSSELHGVNHTGWSVDDWDIFPEPFLTRTYTGTGADYWGRRIQGALTGTVEVGYKYRGCYAVAGGWSQRPNGGSFCNFPVNVWRYRSWRVSVGPFDAQAIGFGGWTLSVHHVYEPETRRLQLGDGGRMDRVGLPRVVRKIFPLTGSINTVATGAIAPAPDGSTYFASGSAIRKARAPGSADPNWFSGNLNGEQGYVGDGIPADDPSVRYGQISDLALADDGALYIADTGNHVIRKIGSDGILSTIAGTGNQQGHSGDGGPAVDALISTPMSLAVGAGGSLYFVEDRRSIRRIDPDGIITTVAGQDGGEQCDELPPDGSIATATEFQPVSIAIAPDGTIYSGIESTTNCGGGLNRIVKLVDRRLFHVAGHGCFSVAESCVARQADGLDAKESSIRPSSLAFDKYGQIYFVDRGRVRTIDSDNTIRTIAGNPTGPGYISGSPATAVSLAGGPVDVALCADGSVCSSVSGLEGGILKFMSPLPSETGASFAVPARDGSSIFTFDAEGRHLSTRHSLTGADLYRFDYDASGHVVGITDAAGLVTQIERSSGSTVATAIISPYGQRTELVADADGYLGEVRDPEGNATSMTYSDGLLSTFTNARGDTSNMTYDGEGRLELDVDPAGGSHYLTRTGDNRTWTVSRSTALGRTTSYATEMRREDSGISFAVTSPAGLLETTVRTPDLVTTQNHADGTRVTRSGGADLRFGVVAPSFSTTTVLPSGLTSVETTTREYQGLNPLDALDFDTRKEQIARNGRTWFSSYTSETRRFDSTSPTGRTAVRFVDPLGRTTRTQVTGLARMDYFYDADGRLFRTIHGTGPLARTTEHTFVASGRSAGYLETMRDPSLDTTAFSRDSLGRVLTETRAVTTTRFTWDELSNLESVTPPGKPTHGMTYTPANLLETYDPPVAGLPEASTSYTYDADRMLRTETRPDGVQIIRTPDSAGRLGTVQIPGGFIDYDYYPAGTPSGAGRPSDISGPYGVDMHFEYDGMLPSSMTWTGAAGGSVVWQYNSDFRKILETVTGGTGLGSASTVFGYDDDQLLTCASWTSCSSGSSTNALILTRDPQRGGLITQIAVGNTSETLGYNAFGELARQTSAYSSSPIADITYDAIGVERDKLGRIVQKTETVLGVTKVYRYTYDALRRLADVTVNGVLEEHFEYDSNGNRTAGDKAGVGTWTGTYDDQDRLLTYGPYFYTYTANGELETKTNTATGEEWLFQYDALGNLLSVGLPNGDLVEYLVDGMGRRVGRKKNGVLLKQWVYRDALKPAAELDGSGNLVAQYAYGSRSNVPDYVRRGGATYRVVSDHLGSPRYVVNVDDAGDVPCQANYSSFGEVTGTGLDWMPFGFAGGIYDGDSGLVRFGVRDHDPLVGRWAAKDPTRWSGRQSNLYVYAGNDPVNRTDPSGLLASGAGATVGPNLFFTGAAAYAFGYFVVGPIVFAIQDAQANDEARAEAAQCMAGGRPNGCPPGTLPIDEYGLNREVIHRIKRDLGLLPTDWVGIDPDGRICFDSGANECICTDNVSDYYN